MILMIIKLINDQPIVRISPVNIDQHHQNQHMIMTMMIIQHRNRQHVLHTTMTTQNQQIIRNMTMIIVGHHPNQKQFQNTMTMTTIHQQRSTLVRDMIMKIDPSHHQSQYLVQTMTTMMMRIIIQMHPKRVPTHHLIIIRMVVVHDLALKMMIFLQQKMNQILLADFERPQTMTIELNL
jgi:hypothetical protein